MMMPAQIARIKPKDTVNSTAWHFLRCIAHAKHERSPYDHWLIDNALPEDVLNAIVALPLRPPTTAAFNGTREVNNSLRIFFSEENKKRFSACDEVACAFSSPQVIRAIEELTGSNLSRGQLRIEYCQDMNGFWLEPHVDISAKLFTMLIYLSGEPELCDAGTDIYDASAEHKRVSTVPYRKNKGLIFIPGIDTWHGFTKRPIRGVRKSIIVNYVSPEWRNQAELAYY